MSKLSVGEQVYIVPKHYLPDLTLIDEGIITEICGIQDGNDYSTCFVRFKNSSWVTEVPKSQIFRNKKFAISAVGLQIALRENIYKDREEKIK